MNKLHDQSLTYVIFLTNSGLEIGGPKMKMTMQGWKMQDRKMQDQKCRTGKCGTMQFHFVNELS